MLNDHLDTALIADLRRQLAAVTTECDQLRSRLIATGDRHSEGIREAQISVASAQALVNKLDAGIERIIAALGLTPGGADFDVIVAAIGRLR